MNSSSLSVKAITCGALIVIAGYIVCMLLVGAMISTSAPRASWIAVGIFALFPCFAAGFIGAYLSTESRVLNGALAGFTGGAVLLVALAAIVPSEAGLVFIGSLLTVTLLAAAGAFVATKLRPRRDDSMSV